MDVTFKDLFATLNLDLDNVNEEQSDTLRKLFRSLVPSSFSKQDDTGNTVFHLMSQHGLLTLLSDCLVQEPNGVFIRNNFGHYPIHTAILNRQRAMVEFLLRVPLVASLVDSRGQNAFHYAARYGSTDMVELCCRVTPELINSLDGEYKTPLMLVVESCSSSSNTTSNLRMLQLLVDYGADVSLTDYHGSTILHKAIDTMNTDLIAWILSHIDKDTLTHPDHDGYSPLVYLRQKYQNKFDFPAVEELLMAKAAYGMRPS